MAAAERELELTQAAQSRIAEATVLLDRLKERLDDGETVLDMAPAVSAGHDGVVVVTDRRLIFLAPRRTFDRAYRSILRSSVRGRWLGSSLTLRTSDGPVVIANLRRDRALAFAEHTRAGARAASR
jgi:hypothetical protein